MFIQLRDVGSQTINTAGVHQFIADEPTKFRGGVPILSNTAWCRWCLLRQCRIVGSPSRIQYQIKQFDVEGYETNAS